MHIQRQIKYLLFPIILLAVLSCNKIDSKEDNTDKKPISIEVKEGMDLVGIVTYTDGSPAKGIVMSDGFTCTTTDENGIYQMKRHKQARHVFFSYPSNCVISCDENKVPNFFRSVNSSVKGVIRHDFELEKRDGVAPYRFVLYLIADSQVKLPEHERRFVSEVIADINDHISKQTLPCIAVTLGDDCDDNLYHISKGSTTTSFESVAKCYGNLSIPCFHVIGNHDHDKSIASGSDYYYRSLVEYERVFSPVNYSFNFGNVHFVVLDNIRYTGPSTYTAGLTDEQIEWLRQDLSYVAADKQVYVMMHSAIRGGANFTNKDELLGLISNYSGKRLFAGHSHYNYHYVHTKFDNIHEWTVSAACGLFWRGTIANDGSPNGYGVCYVGRNEVENAYYKSAQFDDTYQGRMLEPGQFSGWKGAKDKNGVLYTDKVICNVWNSDAQSRYKWKVELYEDGTKTKDMTMSWEQDHSVYDWINKATDLRDYSHNSPMWSVVPNSKSSEKKVKATDPYGNVYWIDETLKNYSPYMKY